MSFEIVPAFLEALYRQMNIDPFQWLFPFLRLGTVVIVLVHHKLHKLVPSGPRFADAERE